MSEYRVNLDIFAGPLDLLLYLVRKDEVDIYDIPIADITEQYLKYVELLKMFDIELAGDFLVMAATLMEIKSVMLLPRPEEDSEVESDVIDPRTELVRQLLEYKKFKDAANMLESSALLRTQRFTRPDSVLQNIEPDPEPELDIEEISIWTLLEAFDTIMQSVGQYQSYDHIHDDTPIDLYQIEMLHRLQTEGAMTLEAVFADRSSRHVMVGLFLALLELVRDQLVSAEQKENKGTIYIKALTDVPAEEAVQNAIYANIEEEAEAAAEEMEQNPEDDEAEPEQEEDEIDEPDDDILAVSEPESFDIEQPAAASEKTVKPQIPIYELPAKPESVEKAHETTEKVINSSEISEQNHSEQL